MPYVCRKCKLYAPFNEFTCPNCHTNALFDFHTEEELQMQGFMLTQAGNREGAWQVEASSQTASDDTTDRPFFDGEEGESARDADVIGRAFFNEEVVSQVSVDALERSEYKGDEPRRHTRDVGFTLRELFARARYYGVLRVILYLALVMLVILGLSWLWSRRLVILDGVVGAISGILPTVVGIWLIWVCLKNLINPK